MAESKPTLVPETRETHPFPMDAESFTAVKPKYQETVIIVPFYGGKRPQIQRHIDFLNDLGFNVVVFEQPTGTAFLPQFMSARQGIGFKHVWADQVESVLNEVQGPKIVFAFSNPCSGAIEAIARRRAFDIRALVCDSGPTARFWRSAVNYLTTEEPVPTRTLRYLMAAVSTTLWSPDFGKTLDRDLEIFPENFPILSIRGWKDHLISPNHIDLVFENHPRLNWQKLSLPAAGHLNGLRDFANEYKPAVRAFLESVATPLLTAESLTSN